jgi:hypothetical protein
LPEINGPFRGLVAVPDVAGLTMRSVLYVLGILAIAGGAALAAHASGYIGHDSMMSPPTTNWWMFGGLLISFVGAAIVFSARGAD